MFAVIPLKKQLQTLIARYHNEIKEYKSKFLHNSQKLCDIHNGQLLREKGGEFILSLTFTSDGVATAVSNVKRSMWPILLILNDLPIPLRFSRQNMLMAALWVKKGVPPMAAFMKAFTEEINELFKEG